MIGQFARKFIFFEQVFMNDLQKSLQC